MVTFDRNARHRPITPATVDINGSNWGPRSTIWAGLRWEAAVYRRVGPVSIDPHLSVPFCHIDDDMPNDDCGWYRIRSRDEKWAFTIANNGAWILQECQTP